MSLIKFVVRNKFSSIKPSVTFMRISFVSGITKYGYSIFDICLSTEIWKHIFVRHFSKYIYFVKLAGIYGSLHGYVRN